MGIDFPPLAFGFGAPMLMDETRSSDTALRNREAIDADYISIFIQINFFLF